MQISFDNSHLAITSVGVVRPKPWPRIPGLSATLDIGEGPPRLTFTGRDEAALGALAQALDEARKQVEVARAQPDTPITLNLDGVLADHQGITASAVA